MENYTVQLTDKSYIIEPQENGTFRILDGEEKIGVVYPEQGDHDIEWKTMDELEEGFVSEIGALISAHNS